MMRINHDTKAGYAFTLIELLVVISIISLLASVVLASLNSAREKGRIGSAKYFATQVDHVESDQAVGIWDFDECSGTTANDRSGNGNNGSLVGGSTWSTDTPMGTGCSIALDGSTGIVSVPDSPSLNVTGPLTMAIWMKTSGSNAYSGLIKKNAGLNGYQVGLGASTGIRSDLFNGSTYISPGFSMNVQDGKWHFVAVVYDGNAAQVYVDGIPGGALTGSGFVTAVAAPLVIGDDTCCGGRFFNGSVDRARVFGKALTASEVGRLYAAELRSRKLSAASR